MATNELFTVTWWETAAAQVIHAAAGGALSVLGAHGLGLIGDVPWYGVLSAAGLSGLVALLLALAGKVNPDSGPATLFVPTPKAVKLAEQRATKPAPAKATPARARRPRK